MRHIFALVTKQSQTLKGVIEASASDHVRLEVLEGADHVEKPPSPPAGNRQNTQAAAVEDMKATLGHTLAAWAKQHNQLQTRMDGFEEAFGQAGLLEQKVKFTGLTQNSQVDPAVRLKIPIRAVELAQILG